MRLLFLRLKAMSFQTQRRAENKRITRKGAGRRMNVAERSNKKVTTRKSFKGGKSCLRTKLK